MPGPNVVNLSLVIGGRYFGLGGALAALAGMLVFPLCGVLLLAALYAQVADHPAVAGALRGMGAVAAGLIRGQRHQAGPSPQRNHAGCSCLLCAGGADLCGHWPAALAAAVGAAGLGGAACVLAYRKLRP